MASRAQKSKAPAERRSLWARIARHAHAQVRFLIALAFGVAVALIVPVEDRVPRILAGWSAGGWLYFMLVLIKMWQAEIEGIKREASIERESRIVVLVTVILGSFFTLLALVTQLGTIKS